MERVGSIERRQEYCSTYVVFSSTANFTCMTFQNGLRLEVHTAVIMLMLVFWVIKLCKPLWVHMVLQTRRQHWYFRMCDYISAFIILSKVWYFNIVECMHQSPEVQCNFVFSTKIKFCVLLKLCIYFQTVLNCSEKDLLSSK